MWPQGAGLGAKIGAINSPIERPALAAAVRADWSGLTEKDYEKSLMDRISSSVGGVPLDLDAIDRLLFYYPVSGSRAVTEILEQNPYPWAKEALVRELRPFQTPELNVQLYHVYKEAVDAQESALKTQPPGTWNPGIESLGSTLPLDCARLLIHKGHDEEFKAFALDRIARIKDADRHPPPLPTQNFSGPRIDTLRIVHNYEISSCEDLLSQLETGPSHEPEPTRTAAKSLKAKAGAQVKIVSVEIGHGAYAPLIVNLGLTDLTESRVRAARVVVTLARDDFGVALEQPGETRFSYDAVGRTSEDVMTALPPPSLSITLDAPSKPAKRLAALKGRLEVVVPDRDPFALVVVDDAISKAGNPLESEAFRRSGMSVTLFDKKACETYAREKGRVFTGPGVPVAYGIPVPGESGSQIGALDLAVLVQDEKGRLVSTEFRTRDGGPIRYNHNGSGHYGSLPGTRLDIYHFEEPIPADAQMVCLLATPESIVVAPFTFTDVALP